MLGKLIRHEFRATGRIMLPVMGALLALALLANLSIRGLTSGLSDVPLLRILFILITVFFGIAIVAAVVMTVVLMVSRFYRNLLRNEGYLMFTLPVSAHALVWSKLIVSLVWFLLTALLIFLVMSLTALNLSNTNLEMIIAELPNWKEITRFLYETGIRNEVFTLMYQAIIGTLLGTLVACLHFYAAMSLGHMFSKDRILLSILFFIGISFVFNLMSTACGFAGFGMSDLAERLESSENESLELLRQVIAIVWYGIATGAVQGGILYLATILGLKRGLNLE